MSFQPSVLAKSFVPEFHTAIWDDDNVNAVCTIKLPKFMYFEEFLEPRPVTFSNPKIPDKTLSLVPTKLSQYGDMFSTLAESEHLERIKAFEIQYSQFNVQVSYWGEDFVDFFIPGLLDSFPPLSVGDWVRMRCTRNGDAAVKKSVFGKTEYLSRIVRIRRIDSMVRIAWKNAPKLPFEKIQELRWYLKFIPSGLGIITAGSSLMAISNDQNKDLYSNYLFPKPPFDPSFRLDAETPYFSQDSNLNEDQKLSVNRILFRTGLAFDEKDVSQSLLLLLRTPYLLIGPSGTGKTGTLASMISEIRKKHLNSRILAVAPSQSAADTMALRLIDLGLDRDSLFRFNTPIRDIASLPYKLHLISFIDQELNTFAIPRNFLGFPIVVCTAFEASLLLHSGFSNAEIIGARSKYIKEMQENLEAMGLPPYNENGKDIPYHHWSHLIIDEAAQATEPELAASLQLVLTPAFNVQVVLAGDPKQLGPILQSQAAARAGLSQSLMERLSMEKVYDTRTDCMSILQSNYRSHPSLLMMPSALFYAKDLLPERSDPSNIQLSDFVAKYETESKLTTCSILPMIETGWPFRFYAVKGKDIHKANEDYDTASWYNVEEAQIILRLIRELVGSGRVNPAEDIGVMTITRQQVICIRTNLRAAGFGSVNVGTVEDYQGMERNIILLSTVRSDPTHIPNDISRGLGVISQPKRMNVAISRARDLLIVVGNPKTLAMEDNLWFQLVLFCDRNKLWMTNHHSESIDINGPFELRPNRLSILSPIGAKNNTNLIFISALEKKVRKEIQTNNVK